MPIGTCPMCGGHCESEFAARLTDGLLGCPVCKQVLSFPDPLNEMPLVRPSECLMCWAKDKRIATLERENASLRKQVEEETSRREQIEERCNKAARQLAESQAQLRWLHDRLMSVDEYHSDAIGLPKGWTDLCAAVDAARQSQEQGR